MASVIMVVEEELNLRLSITQILREAGYIVVDADKACEAREMLPNRHFDLVLLNLKSHSPGELGFLYETLGVIPPASIIGSEYLPKV